VLLKKYWSVRDKALIEVMYYSHTSQKKKSNEITFLFCTRSFSGYTSNDPSNVFYTEFYLTQMNRTTFSIEEQQNASIFSSLATFCLFESTTKY
jgi:hypothetical protein